MSSETETISLNLDGSFAQEAERAARASDQLADALGAVGDASQRIKSPAFSRATDENFKRSKWEQAVPPVGAARGPKAKAQSSGLMKFDGTTPTKGGTDSESKTFGAPKDLKYLLKAAGIGKAAMAAMGAAAGLELTKLALGYKGMAQLQAIGARTGLQIRGLFRGVDPMPVVRAADRLSQIFNPATAAGKALSGMFTRAFNGIFGIVEKAEPYVSAFFKGMIIGAQYAEIGWLNLRLALKPTTDAIADAIGPMDATAGAAVAGGAALTYLGATAAAAAAPFLPLAAAIGAVGAAVDQLTKLSREWNTGDWDLIKNKLAKDIGITSQEDREKALQAEGMANFQASQAKAVGNAPGGQAAAANDNGISTGKAYADGMVQGVGQGAAAVGAAGQSIAKTLDKGVRDAAQIHSPSRLARDTARNYPAGTVQGIDDGAGDVQAAADRSLVPTMGAGAPGAAGGAAGARGGPIFVTIKHEWPAGVEKASRTAIEDAGEAGTWRAIRVLAEQLGVPVELAAA